MGDTISNLFGSSDDDDTTDYPDVTVDTTDDNTAMMAKLMTYFAKLSSAQTNMMMMTQMANQSTSLDTVYETPSVDWEERTSSLRAMMAADYGKDVNNRVTRTDTILTSPLLDEEEADTLSILGDDE